MLQMSRRVALITTLPFTIILIILAQFLLFLFPVHSLPSFFTTEFYMLLLSTPNW